MENVNGFIALHQERFGARPALFQAPGRVNLIGEHTDYAEGFVFPAAIDLTTTVAVTPRTDGQVVLYSANFEKEARIDLDALPERGKGQWEDYPLGVLSRLQNAGISVPAFSLSITGNVPLGAGLSSSASIEVATALALLHLSGTTLSRPEIAKLCQKAENQYVGAPVGIMDQFVSACGAENHALLLDCRSLEYHLAPLPHEVEFVLVNTMVKHAHADGAYKIRRAEVAEGTDILHQMNPGINALRDATLDDLELVKNKMAENVYKRCRHIISENARTVAAAAALDAGDLKKFGELIVAAHASYRDDFEASCPEADILVELALERPECIGARLTGGGFGGCTLNMVRSKDAAAFADALKAGYKEKTSIDADIYRCRASAGAHALDIV
jgi:galactokinase